MTNLNLIVYFTPFLIIVDPIVARSIVVAPISTSSSIITFLFEGFFKVPSGFGAKPKPSAPITEPEWIAQLFPIMVCS
jgi:hypothetical protein